MSCGFAEFSDTRPSPGVWGGSLDLAMLDDMSVPSRAIYVFAVSEPRNHL